MARIVLSRHIFVTVEVAGKSCSSTQNGARIPINTPFDSFLVVANQELLGGVFSITNVIQGT